MSNITTTTTAITHPTNPYFHVVPAPPPPPSSSQSVNNLGRQLETTVRKAETFAGNLYNHLRTGPSVLDVAMTRIDQACRVMADGGCNNVFKKEFGEVHSEMLKASYVCYLSTSTGPVLGTLFVSNKRVGFRSDNPIWIGVGQNGEPGNWVFYKVILNMVQIMAVNPSSNRVRLNEKYIVVLTKDGYEFWFMGFILYEQALERLSKVVQQLKWALFFWTKVT